MSTRRPTFGRQLAALAADLERQGLAERAPAAHRAVSAFDIAELHRAATMPGALWATPAARTCQQCGGPIEPARPAYCSMACAVAARERRSRGGH